MSAGWGLFARVLLRPPPRLASRFARSFADPPRKGEGGHNLAIPARQAFCYGHDGRTAPRTKQRRPAAGRSCRARNGRAARAVALVDAGATGARTAVAGDVRAGLGV